MTKEEIEDMLKEYLNCEKVIWLKDGIDPDETNGHIDDVACFVAPGEVACIWTDDPEDPFYEVAQQAYGILSEATDAKGRKLKVHKLTTTKNPVLISGDFDIDCIEGTIPREDGEICISSYMNFLIVNGGVFHAEYVGSSSDVSGPGCINNKANAVINGGLFTSNNLRTYAVISSGNIEINNATVEGAHGALAVDDGLATINGGTFCADVHYGLYAINSTVTVKGGTFTGGSTGVDVYSDADANVTIGENAVLNKNKKNGSGSVIFEKINNVENATNAQTALDSAVSGTVIQLAKNVHYGTLYLRQSDLSVSVDVSNWAGDSDVERFRSIENLTILGAEGATVDCIKIEAGTYTPSILHSNSDKMNYLQSYIAIKNLKISGVTFTGAKNAFEIVGKVSVDGLTIENCAMQDDGNNVLLYASGTTTDVYTDKLTNKVFLTKGIKNVTVTGCTIIGANKVIELRETENVTISNNVFKNIVARDILLVTNSGCSYTGEINIVGNLSDGSTERFLRASNVNAKVTLIDNVVTNWSSSEGDTDIVKFSGNGANISFTLEGNAWNGETDDQAKLSGTVNLG